MSRADCGRNRYTFSWLIEDFYAIVLPSFDAYEIRSPLFITENVGRASWFLAIRDTSLPSGVLFRAACSLTRYSDDEGADQIPIQFQLTVTAADDYYRAYNLKKASTVSAFKKGYSSRGCDLQLDTRFQNHTHVRKSLIIQCHITEYHSLGNPISIGSTVRTKINELDWVSESLLEMTLVSAPQNIYGSQGVQYEVFFHVLNDAISIRIRRSDRNNSIKCFMFCDLGVDYYNKCPIDNIDRLLKPFHINETFDVPTSLAMNELSDAKFKNPKCIFGIILTSFLINVQSSKPEGKLADMSIAHEFDSADMLRKEQLRMYVDGIHADVELQIGSKSIPAHKCILASRSPVFSAMFDEEQTGIVRIADVDEGTMDALLKYLYTTVVEGLDFESALKLLVAADKYQVVPLREKCATHLKDSLSVENACEVLAVAEKTSHQDLKSQAMDYVKAHADEILLSKSWIQLVRLNYKLMAEILTAISK